MAVNTRTAIEIPAHTSVILNSNMSDAQKNAGIVGKGRFVHPCFSTSLTVRNGVNGTQFIKPQDQAQAGGKGFDSVVLFKSGIIPELMNRWDALKNPTRTATTPWYMSMVGRTVTVTDEMANESIGLVGWIQERETTENMVNALILGSFTIHTDVADLKNVVISISAFDQSLRISEPAIDKADYSKGECFRLTPECKAQVLAFFHNQIDWSKIVTAQSVMQTRIGARQSVRKAEEQAIAEQKATAIAILADIPDESDYDDVPM
jgi:hypothetical protein